MRNIGVLQGERYRLSARWTPGHTRAMEKWLIQAPNTDYGSTERQLSVAWQRALGSGLQPPQDWSPAMRASNEIPQGTLAALWACAVSTLVWSTFLTLGWAFLSLLPLSTLTNTIVQVLNTSAYFCRHVQLHHPGRLNATSPASRARDKTQKYREILVKTVTYYLHLLYGYL